MISFHRQEQVCFEAFRRTAGCFAHKSECLKLKDVWSVVTNGSQFLWLIHLHVQSHLSYFFRAIIIYHALMNIN